VSAGSVIRNCGECLVAYQAINFASEIQPANKWRGCRWRRFLAI